MRVISVPARLRLAAVLLFLCVPIAALETVVVTRAPWWRLPYQLIGLWSGAVFLVVLPLSVWIMRGKSGAVRALEFFFAAWLGINVWVAVRSGSSGLGFLTVSLLALFGIWAVWIRHEMRRSFFDPRMTWYQGLPRPLPGITCRYSAGDREVECRVSRIDREGAFIFQSASSLGEAPLGAFRSDTRSELVFGFRERSVRCTGVAVRALDGNRGAGFQFDGLAPDLRKQLGDFIETLKGEGYVL